jgi:hypothetical protein
MNAQKKNGKASLLYRKRSFPELTERLLGRRAAGSAKGFQND